MASAITANPQTFNRYSYVTNSPLTLIDPSGMFGISPGGSQLGGIGSLGNFSLNSQTSEDTEQPQQQQPQPQQPKPIATQTANLPVDEIPQCHMCFGQIPTTVVVDQLNAPTLTVVNVNGTRSLVVGVDLRFTFLDQNGDPISGTVTESVEPRTVIQTKSVIPLSSGGEACDLVSNSLGYVPTTTDQQRAAVQFFNESFTNPQTATVSVVSDTGMSATVTHQRTLTNTIPGAPTHGQGLIRGYTFTMNKLTIRFP